MIYPLAKTNEIINNMNYHPFHFMIFNSFILMKPFEEDILILGIQLESFYTY